MDQTGFLTAFCKLMKVIRDESFNFLVQSVKPWLLIVFISSKLTVKLRFKTPSNC
uniref:Uncharacterized protein n=1 Tax=Tetranychus urticae TaxID=32264 RepID=T1KAD8_TETUR